MKFKEYIDEKTELDMDNVLSDVKELRKSLYAKYKAMDSNTRTIKAAKQIAKQYKIKYTEILKLFKPDNNIAGAKTWDSTGIIK